MLAFNKSLWKDWKKNQKNEVYDKDTQFLTKTFGKNELQVLVTPKIKQYVNKHFGCDNNIIDGASFFDKDD